MVPHYDTSPAHHCPSEMTHEEVMVLKQYAYQCDDYYEDFVIERDFETHVGYYPCVTLTNPNLNHLRGDLTRWLKGAAAHFG